LWQLRKTRACFLLIIYLFIYLFSIATFIYQTNMSVDQEVAEIEEAAAMDRQQQRIGICIEIEDRSSFIGVNFNEHYQTQDYENARHQHEGSVKMLGVDPAAFPFCLPDPSPLMRTKEEMFYVSFVGHQFDSISLLYVSPSIEYYTGGHAFNKKSRRWSFCQGYVSELAEKLCTINMQQSH
jgi:hypothetical protein